MDGIPLRVVHTPWQGAPHRASPSSAGAHALRYYTEYFDQPYPGDKLDLVAIPDFAFGAMENLGCVTFREVALLTDPGNSVARRARDASPRSIEHEIAHMWFGDLVTMSWWNGIWLNEAFATYMRLCCLDDFRPEYQCWVSFGRDREMALALDGLHTTRPIEFPVRTPTRSRRCSTPSPTKRAAAFSGCSSSTSAPSASATACAATSPRTATATPRRPTCGTRSRRQPRASPIRALMDSWIRQGGHPLVTARAAGPRGRADPGALLLPA